MTTPAIETYLIPPETVDPQQPEWQLWQQRMRQRFPATIYARGFSVYKKRLVRRFFQGSKVIFDCSPAQFPAQSTLVLWGRTEASAWEKQNCQIVRLEDGFIRSVGLGADLIPPLSWALDTRSIYYDASQVSDLEQILQNCHFDKVLQTRARKLSERLVDAGLTKYNVGSCSWQKPRNASHPVILIPGQVESDASLAFGAPKIRQNLALLKAVRSAHPNAYLIYKPHPDVVAGLREKDQNEADVSQWCDEIVVDVAMGQLLDSVDEVHTLTSLAGFEALLRGKCVVCYGLPFYAGWGLTNDLLSISRRSRRLSLDEMVAGTLIVYPTYVSRVTGLFATPEQTLDELLDWREKASVMPWWRVIFRRFLQLELWLKSNFNQR